MSLHLEFEPHSWYMFFAIKKDDEPNDPCEFTYEVDSKVCTVHDQKVNPFYNYCDGYHPKWEAFTDDGNTYNVVNIKADTLKELKAKIRDYWRTGPTPASLERYLKEEKE